MKVSIFKTALWVLVIAFALPVSANWHCTAEGVLNKKEFSKTIKESFPISSNGEIQLGNKFGEIKVNTWSENKVAVTVTILVHADNESDAQKTFDRISIGFDASDSRVAAETEIESASKNWSWWNHNKGDSFEINYEVKVPATVKLDLELAHGNAYVDALSGDVRMDVKHGNFRLTGVAGDLDVELAHGNGTIGKAKNADLDIRHSNIHIKAATTVDLDTRHSNIEIDAATEVDADSGHDNYDIGAIQRFDNDGRHDNIDIKSVQTINMDAKYSDVDINELLSEADFDLEFGGVDIRKLAKDFRQVLFEGTHSELDIRVATGANYQVEIEGTHASLDYPTGMTVSTQKEQHHEYEVKGYVGSNSGGRMIKVSVSHGSVDIK